MDTKVARQLGSPACLAGLKAECRTLGFFRSCLIVAASSTFAMAAATAETASPGYVGVWASSAEACHGDPNSTQDIAIRFTATAIIGHEWGCRIGDVRTDAQGWRARLACSVEGTPSVRRVRWHLDKDGTLRETEKGNTDVYVRCKDSDFRVGR